MPLPLDWKAEIGNDRVPQRTWLKMPVIGMESEFNVWLDGKEIIPEDYWKHPSAFIDAPLLSRTKKSSQLPTGGAVYFDRGVIEVVTPVIELDRGCSARMVRNLWEQIEFVRDQLTQWERRTGHHVRLKAYSSHYNVSFELKKHEQNALRNIKKLALLLAYILPVPVMILGANRRSTGVGVRPRSNRIEITVDFTPDPGLMIAAATLVVGVVREILTWPSYELSLLDRLPIPVIAGVIPGKHTTRKGWLTKDFHYPQSPYTSDIDAPIWTTRRGDTMSLREMARMTACFFRKSIRKFADPFSYRLLFAIMEGRAPSMLELHDRPIAYEDVGRLCRWGMVLPELQSFRKEQKLRPVAADLWRSDTMDEFIAARDRERVRYQAAAADRGPKRINHSEARPNKDPEAVIPAPALAAPRRKPGARRRIASATAAPRHGNRRRVLAKRKTDTPRLLPPRTSDYLDRRVRSASRAVTAERRRQERRRNVTHVPFPDRRLTRSAYESVFLKLVSGARLRMGTDVYKPVGMKGWYHAIFRRESDGSEKLLTIDQLLEKMSDWN